MALRARERGERHCALCSDLALYVRYVYCLSLCGPSLDEREAESAGLVGLCNVHTF